MSRVWDVEVETELKPFLLVLLAALTCSSGDVDTVADVGELGSMHTALVTCT